MTIKELIKELQARAIDLAEDNALDIWESGYLQALIDLRLELERGEKQGYAKLRKENANA